MNVMEKTPIAWQKDFVTIFINENQQYFFKQKLSKESNLFYMQKFIKGNSKGWLRYTMIFLLGSNYLQDKSRWSRKGRALAMRPLFNCAAAYPINQNGGQKWQ